MDEDQGCGAGAVKKGAAPAPALTWFKGNK